MRIGPFGGAVLALAIAWPLAAAAQLLTPAPPDARPAEEAAHFAYRTAAGAEEQITGVVTWMSRNGEGGAVVEGRAVFTRPQAQLTVVIGPDIDGDFVFDLEMNKGTALPVGLTALRDVALGPIDDLQALDALPTASVLGPGHWQLAYAGGLRQADIDRLKAASDLHFIFDTEDGGIAALHLALGNSGDFVIDVSAIGWVRDNLIDGRDHFGAFVVDPRWPQIVFLEGDILRSDGESFRQALVAHPGVGLVVLDSDGGDGEAASLIADSIDALGIDTLIPSNGVCASACATIFLAGRQRVVLGTLGVHRFGYFGESPAENTIAAIADDLEAMVDFDAPMPVILASLQTPHDTIRSFTRGEAEAIGLNRGSLDAMRGFDPAILDLPLFRSGATLFRIPASGDTEEFAGAIVWRSTPSDSPVAAQATVTFPDRDLTVTLTIRSVDLVPAGAEAVDISIQGIEAATLQTVYGVSIGALPHRDSVPLPGRLTVLGTNRYRLALDPAFRERYLELLARNEIAVPFVLADGISEVVVIDVGYDGAATIDEVLANLPAPPAAATEPQSATFTLDGGAPYRGTVVWDDAGEGATGGASVFIPVLDLWARVEFGVSGTMSVALSETLQNEWQDTVRIRAVAGRAGTGAATPMVGIGAAYGRSNLTFDFTSEGDAARILSASAWLDLTLSLGDGTRATLSLQTGEPGGALLAGVVRDWGTP